MENHKKDEDLNKGLKKVKELEIVQPQIKRDLIAIKDLLDSSDPLSDKRHAQELIEMEESIINYLSRKVLVEQFGFQPDASEVEQSTLDLDILLDTATEAIKLKFHRQLDCDGANSEWHLPSNGRA